MTAARPIQTDALTRLDNMPWTRFHTLLTVALGIGWALDSFETNIIGSVFGVLKAQWHLSSTQGSLAVSMWVIGMLIGAIGFGYLADRYGRKRLFLGTLLWYAAFSIATVFSWNYESFLFFRVMTALAVGGEYSAVTATMGEFIPKRHRGRTDASILSGFPLGALASAAVTLLLLNHLPRDIAWRVGFGLGTTLALLFFWIRRVIPESPRWLLQQGRLAEVEAIVERIAASASSPGMSAALQEQACRRYAPSPYVPATPAFMRNIRELFGAYRLRCGLASALNFSQVAVVYGVLSLMALVILPYMKVPADDMPIYYVYGNAAALLGGLTASWLVEAWGRRLSLLASYSFTALAIVPLYVLHTLPGMVTAYCLIQFGVTWAYISGYVVSSEVLPTRMRATGLGISVAVGRVGAMLAPLSLTYAYQASGSPSSALLVLLLLALPGPIAAALWWRMGTETRNVSLEEGSVENGATPQSSRIDARYGDLAPTRTH
ncbi:MAG: putative niacin/nicotinamide transporter NaiP [Luteibacter sp.]|uniref:MFS transporter n=1 Tax=Luteibacter sp. TaxID=1886636 RepID=UPI0013829BD0|nr:MFS transporter [Luteibacter sp.]KAF1005970.1 MAG: putative niacin/nicotinamide transporter NaiP [Luteibacter sp.]